MDGIKYNKPPPEPPRRRAPTTTTVPIELAKPLQHYPERDPRDRASEPIKASLDDLPPPGGFGKVSSLSALFDKPDE